LHWRTLDQLTAEHDASSKNLLPGWLRFGLLNIFESTLWLSGLVNAQRAGAPIFLRGQVTSVSAARSWASIRNLREHPKSSSIVMAATADTCDHLQNFKFMLDRCHVRSLVSV